MKNYIGIGLLSILLVSCGGSSENKDAATGFVKVEFPGLYSQATTFFSPLPEAAPNELNPSTEAKINLGYTLYYDTRLSKDGNISCNSCHNLATYGVDNLPTSPGDDGTLGERNSPTVLNAALHFVQFWDGREPDVEAQAGGPVLNPVEMAMPSEDFVMNRIKEIEGYSPMFREAFPGEEDPFVYDNLKKAIGAFERELLTPSSFDKYLAGDKKALSRDEQEGLKTFIDQGCITCHMGSTLGGTLYQKMGVYANYAETIGAEHDDLGRFTVTNNEADKYIFKVPSMRNVAKTAPYFHDGAVASLDESVSLMAKIQLNKDLTDDQVKSIVVFLNSLTGEVPAEYQKAPEMPM